MTLPPETRYAPAADGLNIAYQVTGGGDVDLVFMQGAVAHLELAWEDTRLSRLFEQKGRADRFSFPQFGQSMSLFLLISPSYGKPNVRDSGSPLLVAFS